MNNRININHQSLIKSITDIALLVPHLLYFPFCLCMKQRITDYLFR